MGVTSWGSALCQGTPGVYANVAQGRRFIDRAMAFLSQTRWTAKSERRAAAPQQPLGGPAELPPCVALHRSAACLPAGCAACAAPLLAPPAAAAHVPTARPAPPRPLPAGDGRSLTGFDGVKLALPATDDLVSVLRHARL